MMVFRLRPAAVMMATVIAGLLVHTHVGVLGHVRRLRLRTTLIMVGIGIRGRGLGEGRPGGKRESGGDGDQAAVCHVIPPLNGKSVNGPRSAAVGVWRVVANGWDGECRTGVDEFGARIQA